VFINASFSQKVLSRFFSVFISPCPSERHWDEFTPGMEQHDAKNRDVEADAASRIAAEQPPSEKKSVETDEKTEILVEWDGHDDPENPQNWSTSFKSWVTFQLGMLAFGASLASSIIAPANKVIAEYVGVSEDVVVLNVSLYVVGFAFGPLMWAPFSEVWGRRVSMLPAAFCLVCFSVGTGLSRNAASVFLNRFFSGFFGSAAVSNVNAALGDIWSREVRGTAVCLYGLCVVGGPTLGPTIGAAILVNPHMGWRWTEYFTALLNAAVVACAYFCMPEMYPPVLLKWKAQRLRKQTGNKAYYHPHERIKVDVKSIITKQLSRPLKMLFTEPMVTLIAFYASFVYAILYLTLQVFPIVFQEQRGWSPVVGSLPFLGMFVGILAATGVNLGNQPIYRRNCAASNGKPIPEARLPPLAIGAVLMVIGLFWFAWTAEPKYPWPSPVVAAGFVGGGFNIIFQQCTSNLPPPRTPCTHGH
jgi:MFS family permease